MRRGNLQRPSGILPGGRLRGNHLLQAGVPVLSPAEGLPGEATLLNSLPVVNPATGAFGGIVSRTELYRTGILLLRKPVARD